MRKHFLLLFVLTLLPFTGWAQGIDIKDFAVSLGTVSYQYNAATPDINNAATPDVKTFKVTNPANSERVPASEVDLVFYTKSGETYTEVPTDQLATLVKNVGTYAVAARAKEGSTLYSGESAKIEFNITKKQVTVSYDVTATGDKALDAIFYGEATPTLDVDKLFYDGFLGSDTKAVVDATGFTAVINKTTASAEPDGDPLVVTPGATPVYMDPSEYTLSGLTATNYSFTYKKVTLRIKQIDLATVSTDVPADGKNYIVFATNKKGAKAFTYNADAQYPTYTITYYDGQGNPHSLNISTATENKDYTVTYDKKPLSGASPAYTGTYDAVVKDAAWYKGKINAVANGNYANSRELVEADFEYQIAKKGITLYVQPMEGKTYDGAVIPVTLVDLTTTEDTYQPGDDINVTGATVVCPVFAADNGLKANIKVHFANPAYNKLAYNDGEDHPATTPKNAGEYGLVPYLIGEGLGNNYDVEDGIIEVGSYTIARRPVKVTALDQTFTYTGAKQYLTTTKSATTYKAEAIDGVAASGLVGGAGETAALEALFTIALKDGVEIKETVNAAYTGAIEIVVDDEDEAASNYDITEVAGNVIVNGKKLFVIVPTFEKEYGYELAAADLTPLLNVSGVSLEGTPAYIVKDADENEYEIGDLLPRGTYTVSIVQGSVSAPTNYSIDRYEDGTITIGKKTLKVKVKNQTVKVGDTDAALVQTAAYFEYVKGFEPVTVDGVQEVIKYTITGATGNTASATGAGDPAQVINFDITTAYAALTPEQKLAFKNENYDLQASNVTKGFLTVVAANTVILKREEADLVNFIKNNKGTAANQTVHFADDRNIVAETWNSFVLPFDIDVKDLSKAAGVDYCIVNVLNPTATKVVNGKAQVRFNLTMKKIAANTPFLMKTLTNKPVGTAIVVNNVKVVDPVETSVKNADEDITFNALYARKDMQTYDRFPNNTADNAQWIKGGIAEDGKQIGLKALAAYVEVPDGVEARIFVEDLENGTTVIKELGVDGTNKAYNIEGWYTLDGIKLQGVPTEKGIYINNGKKVVIK